MRQFTRTVFLRKEDITMLDKDMNAKESYVVYSNHEQGTTEVDITLQTLEEFRVTEDVLDLIVEGLLPALGERDLELKKEQVKRELRSKGLSI